LQLPGWIQDSRHHVHPHIGLRLGQCGLEQAIGAPQADETTRHASRWGREGLCADKTSRKTSSKPAGSQLGKPQSSSAVVVAPTQAPAAARAG
jgi:hypothetical protein